MNTVKNSHAHTLSHTHLFFVCCHPLWLYVLREYGPPDESWLSAASWVTWCLVVFRIPAERRRCCSSWERRTTWFSDSSMNWWVVLKCERHARHRQLSSWRLTTKSTFLPLKFFFHEKYSAACVREQVDRTKSNDCSFWSPSKAARDIRAFSSSSVVLKFIAL